MENKKNSELYIKYKIKKKEDIMNIISPIIEKMNINYLKNLLKCLKYYKKKYY